MRWIFRLFLVCLVCAFCCLSLTAQEVEVDVSTCRGMYTVLKAMRDGAPKEQVASMLDALLDTQPYRVMFQHYNRSWRPNHLPKDVFKRMILSLRFPQEYSVGENERADTMRGRWTNYYPDLSTYESQMHQLETADLGKLINEGVRYAQGWLPPDWKIPNFYLAVIPNGGSPAFSIERAQGYDFLQLAQVRPGVIDTDWLVGTVAHESHHLGMRANAPANLSAADDMAYRVVNLCIAEGAATYFISGSPEGRVPPFLGARFHVFTPDMKKAWNDHIAEEEEIVRHQAALLDRAVSGELTNDAFSAELRDYWLNGLVGRAYVLGADMVGAIYTAFGKGGLFSAMQNPRGFFELYNKALDENPAALKRCARIPDKAVKQALAIGQGH